ncbi:MAG: helix-turn-helix domain-containing protein [Gracilibacteraceae bacterium]|jgi:transcriptional regulator with XRE-family HTH domain|nr:helix-turn-helix domain-containing protein [Gracilibacteraceae bacterium]
MKLNERFRYVRKDKGLSQSEFGERLGVSRSVVNNWERGVVVPSGPSFKAVCSVFGVNETWLRTGEGDIFHAAGVESIDHLAKKYSLNETERNILEIYLTLPKTHREMFVEYVRNLVKNMETKQKPEEPRIQGLTEEEALALVRERYAAAKKGNAESTTSEKADTA